jgi:HTTM domain
MTGRARRLVTAWSGFFFEPTPTSTLALVRIALGVVVLGWALSMAGDIFAFFGPDGVQPRQPGGAGAWGLLGFGGGDVAVGLLYSALILAAIALVLGIHTRLAAVVTFLALLSFERRSPFVINAGDQLLRVIAFYLMLAPAGAALSVDRWRRGLSLWEFPRRAPWALRLIQLQLSIVYLAAVWAKVRGTTWNDGTAVSYALRLVDLERFPVPAFVPTTPGISALLTYGTLGIELSVAILVWNRRLRPWVLALGVLMHLGIDWSLRVGFFSLAVFVMYAAFIPPERASATILALRTRALSQRHVRLPARTRQLAPGTESPPPP